jgi:hypothetical protein
VILLGACLALARCGGSVKHVACVTPDVHRYQETTTTVGKLVYAARVESDAYTNRHFPRSFPWMDSYSSNPEILKPVAVCEGGETSLPVEIYALRALRPGVATIHIPLASAWRSARLPPKTGIRPYERTVIVKP